MISVVINADNRHGYLNESSTVGDFGSGSLQGVRSVDLLTEGVKNKMDFFRGYDCQCVLYIDVHEQIPNELMEEIREIVYSYGNDSKIILNPHSKEKYKWNDWLYIDALKQADGNFIAHFDNDANAIRTDDFDIVEHYLYWLGTAWYKYVCQPWDGIGDKMYHASTRFFICKRETLDLPLIEKAIYWGEVNGFRNPCLEFTLGGLANGNVLYPPRNDEKYLVWSWARYFKGTMKRLNEMKPEDALNYVSKELGLHGANDCMDKLITNE